MHGLFAIADPSLVFISITFSPLFYDFIRLLDENWDTLVQAIEDGQLPELGDLGDVKPHLQVCFFIVCHGKGLIIHMFSGEHEGESRPRC